MGNPVNYPISPSLYYNKWKNSNFRIGGVAAMSLSINTRVKNGTYEVDIIGVMDYATVDDFNHVTEIPDNVKDCVINFSELEFTDSTGIGLIISIIYAASNHKIPVKFMDLSPDVKEVFDTIGIFKILEASAGGRS
jgi:anti-anti-sigma factor